MELNMEQKENNFELKEFNNPTYDVNKSKEDDCDSSSTNEMKNQTDKNNANDTKDDGGSSSNVDMKSVQSQSDNESNSTLTRNIEEKIKLSSNVSNHVISDMDSSSLNSSYKCNKGSNNISDSSSTGVDKKDNDDDDDFIPPLDVNMVNANDKHDENKTVLNVNGVNDNNDSDNIAGPSNTAVTLPNTNKQRPKCKYGKQCYRKNPKHKEEFCHKGDSDYETSSSEESETDRPECSYGTSCFRKNKEHRKMFSHKGAPSTRKRKKPTKGSKSPTTNSPKKRRKLLDNQNKASLDVNMSSEDSYDYDDPFLNDATEDEFVPTSSLSESSSGSELEPEDDSHTTRRLIKEAKRFVKKKPDD